MAIWDGYGIAFYDASDPSAPRFIGVQTVSGVALDLVFTGSSVFVANDLGLVAIDRVYTPPHIARSLINISSNGVSSATVTGSTLAVSPATTVSVKDVNTGAVSSTAACSTRSFTATVAGLARHSMSLTATHS